MEDELKIYKSFDDAQKDTVGLSNVKFIESEVLYNIRVLKDNRLIGLILLDEEKEAAWNKSRDMIHGN
jgi:hypothetical protein